ncbi:Adenylate cyclase 1 [Planctomycetes bacterium Pan216]|uniref:Adenylate cyclase 1 n=1 Tax=Kolteria novifilia TaxID=2527975 RepID=A0A518B4D1_9BACT|nr:Adenylate cyclase 1 [Planctomycetes bacterium Pan216]
MFHVRVLGPREQREFLHDGNQLEFGRAGVTSGLTRCVLQDPFVSRDHLRLEDVGSGRVIATNLSKRNIVRVTGDEPIGVGEERTLAMPVELTIGETLVTLSIHHSDRSEPDQTLGVGELEADDHDERHLATIHEPIQFRYDYSGNSLIELRESISPDLLTQWFETVLSVQQAAATSNEFYARTARALVELVGLDRGLVLLREGEGWKIVARFGPEAFGKEYSGRVVRSVVEEKRTFYDRFETDSQSASLVSIEAVVASPVFGAEHEVSGIVYGSRSFRPDLVGDPITELEARIVQLLAASVGTGRSRMDHQQKALESRERFARFFSPELAEELERDPHMLDGQEREVTILFLDLRGFSRLSERLNPHDLYRLAEDYMDAFTQRVIEQGGVVVDYAGDGALAMWNAPKPQEGHPDFACRAALEMIGDLPELNERWNEVTGRPLGLGIGINTGPSLVGNAGSRTRLKYGPRGHTVNLCSRIEGATKHLGVPVIVSGFTKQKLDGAFPTRRLCRVRVVGLEEPVELFELYCDGSNGRWTTLRDTYETALRHYENGEWEKTVHALYPAIMTPEGHQDKPTLLLLGHAISCLNTPPKEFDPVFELTSK